MSRTKAPPPPPPVVGKHATEYEHVQLERDGKLDLAFRGYLVAAGTYESADKSRKTTAEIYRTRAGNFVYYVEREHNGTASFCTADHFPTVEALKEFITSPDANRFGRATRDAWAELCEALDVPDDIEAEVID